MYSRPLKNFGLALWQLTTHTGSCCMVSPFPRPVKQVYLVLLNLPRQEVDHSLVSTAVSGVYPGSKRSGGLIFLPLLVVLVGRCSLSIPSGALVEGCHCGSSFPRFTTFADSPPPRASPHCCPGPIFEPLSPDPGHIQVRSLLWVTVFTRGTRYL